MHADFHPHERRVRRTQRVEHVGKKLFVSIRAVSGVTRRRASTCEGMDDDGVDVCVLFLDSDEALFCLRDRDVKG